MGSTHAPHTAVFYSTPKKQQQTEDALCKSSVWSSTPFDEPAPQELWLPMTDAQQEIPRIRQTPSVPNMTGKRSRVAPTVPGLVLSATLPVDAASGDMTVPIDGVGSHGVCRR
ncbi:hypothetical protein S40288_11242 [Stachybotrys chartarum IBT 40288]|nr:hypothetical protein S40288_11242 [Stachybotrys chartarum IBT 40288]